MNRKGGKKDGYKSCVYMYAHKKRSKRERGRKEEKAPNNRWMDVTLAVANVVQCPESERARESNDQR